MGLLHLIGILKAKPYTKALNQSELNPKKGFFGVELLWFRCQRSDCSTGVVR